jgi:hypothetical protein
MPMTTNEQVLTIPDRSQMRGEIQEFLTTKERLVVATMSISVTDEPTCRQASEFLASTLVPLRKKIEEKRKQYATTLRRLATEWDKEFVPALESVDGLISYLKESILAFRRVQEEEARKLQEELDRKAEEERKAAEQRGESPQIPEPITELAPAVTRTVRSNGGSSTVRKVPYVEIFDESKLPRAYLMPNKPLIDQDVKAGLEVPGARLAYRDELAVRTK